MAKITLKKDIGGLKNPSSKYEILPAGKYLLQFVNAEEKESKDGHAGIKMIYNVVEPEDHKGVEVSDYLSFKFDDEVQDYPSGWKIKMTFLAFMGKDAKFDVAEFDTDPWLDHMVCATIRPKTNLDGFENNEVKNMGSVWNGKSLLGTKPETTQTASEPIAEDTEVSLG